MTKLSTSAYSESKNSTFFAKRMIETRQWISRSSFSLSSKFAWFSSKDENKEVDWLYKISVIMIVNFRRWAIMKTVKDSTFSWSNMLILSISFIISDDWNVNEKNFEMTSINEESFMKTELNRLKTIICSKRLIAIRKTILSIIHSADHDLLKINSAE